MAKKAFVSRLGKSQSDKLRKLSEDNGITMSEALTMLVDEAYEPIMNDSLPEPEVLQHSFSIDEETQDKLVRLAALKYTTVTALVKELVWNAGKEHSILQFERK